MSVAINGLRYFSTYVARASVARALPLVRAARVLRDFESRAATRRAFLSLIDRPSTALDPECREGEPVALTRPAHALAPGQQTPQAEIAGASAGSGAGSARVESLRRMVFSYGSEPGQRVPGIMLFPPAPSAGRPPALRAPAVIVLHGTGRKKESYLSCLKRLALAGFIAVGIDGRCHGERATRGGHQEYDDAIAQAFARAPGAAVGRRQFPFLYDTVWDVMRLIDYLRARGDVDGSRIGLMGFSKGGMETYLTAAADTRVAAAVPCLGVQSFAWALENNAWRARVETIQSAFDQAARSVGVETIDADFVRRFYERVIPGIHDRFDGPAMLPMIAPRPLLAINGDDDDKTPAPGVGLCAAAAERAYGMVDAGDRFALRMQAGSGHTVTPDSMDAAIRWFSRWIGSGDENA